MGKVRRGNYVFISWIGDHGHHVHVYKDGRQVLKFDLDEQKPISGTPTRRLLKLIFDLQGEGKL
ncbi:MAG TPA: hypothetical protein VI895_04910 [Bdellovibrionota bacterium]|nr:hypothetical protein [Bdellovibrionota bacterium]